MKVVRYVFWTGLILSLLIVLLALFGSRQIGRLSAEYDLWRGRYEIHGFGLFLGVPADIEDLKAYGIEYRHVAGCVVNDFIIKSVDAYNATMIRAIKENLNIEIDWPVDTYEAMQDAMETMDTDSTDGPGKVLDGSSPSLYTVNPEDIEGPVSDIGDCFYNGQVELDGDSTPEEVCLRYSTSEGGEDLHTYTSLVVDLSKGKKTVLRQGIDRGVYFEERFVCFRDIDSDGRAELITRVRFSSDCSGCDAYRIYDLNDYRFELKINLFEIGYDHPSLQGIVANLADRDKTIVSCLKETTKSEYPCGVYESCIISEPWSVDTDRDGRLETVALVEPPKDDFDFTDQPDYVFWSTFSAAGEILHHELIPLPIENHGRKTLLGFLETRDKNIHLLVNSADIGTSSGIPILNVFDLHYPEIREIGHFGGFYEHAVSERLRDLDGDGNTEIIFVGESSVPPDAANADITLSYEIAEYRDGRYVESNAKLK